MDQAAGESVVTMLLAEIRDRLTKAAIIATAAHVCATEGNVEKAVEIVLDVEQLSYEAGSLLNGASTIYRITRP
jgi:hypothetical protein